MNLAHQHHSWTAPNLWPSLKLSEPVIGRSSANKYDVLVTRDFRLDETIFSDVKLSVRYLPSHIDADNAATLAVTRRDDD